MEARGGNGGVSSGKGGNATTSGGLIQWLQPEINGDYGAYNVLAIGGNGGAGLDGWNGGNGGGAKAIVGTYKDGGGANIRIAARIPIALAVARVRWPPLTVGMAAM